MDALGVTIAILLVIGALIFIGFFVFVATFIYKQYKKISQDHKDFDQRWNSKAWDKFHK